MTGPHPSWVSVRDAARIVDRSLSAVYLWLELPEETTKIRRLKVRRRTYLETRSVLDYEATLTIGRPRKAKP